MQSVHKRSLKFKNFHQRTATQTKLPSSLTCSLTLTPSPHSILKTGNVVVRISTSRPGSLSVDCLDKRRSFRPVLVFVGEETFRVGKQAFSTLEDVLTAVRAKAIYPDLVWC
jgi:hypothetical protein